MSGEGTIALKWRLVVSIIGTFIILVVMRKLDDLFVAITFFIVLLVTISVSTKLAS